MPEREPQATHRGRLIEVTGSHLVVFEFEGRQPWSLDLPKSVLPAGALDAGELELTLRVPDLKYGPGGGIDR